MEDEDSGIFQSRTETSSLGETGSLNLNTTTISTSLDELDTSESDDSDVNSLSSISTDGGTSSDEIGRQQPKPENKTTPCDESSKKKRLSIADSFPHEKRRTKSISHSLPGMQEGHRDEHWEFQDGVHSEISQIKLAVNETKTRPKRVLKVQLPTTSAASNESSNISTPDSSPMVDGVRLETAPDIKDDSQAEEAGMKFLFELRDSDQLQCSEWKNLFGGCANVTISHKPILQAELTHHALVIPGNSFGFLDGEPEIQYTEKFGWKLQKDIQKVIREKYDGELLVGQAVIVPLGKSALETPREDGDYPGMIRYAIYAPTMRVPLQVGDTVNAYLAFRAALREAKLHNERSCEEVQISTVLCPSLCNGFGSMPPGRIALQMKTAYDAVISGKRPDILSPKDLGSMATNHVEMARKNGR